MESVLTVFDLEYFHSSLDGMLVDRSSIEVLALYSLEPTYTISCKMYRDS